MMLLLPKYRSTILFNGIKGNIKIKSTGLMCTKTNDAISTDDKQYTPIYQISRSMPYVIGLSKLKKYQAAAMFGLIPTCYGLNALGYLNPNEVICASLVGFGFTAGLHLASWLLTNNLVVFVYLNEGQKKCRMSYISYWGDRAELYCDLEDIEPIQCSKLDILNYKIKVKGRENTFKIISHDATIFNNAKFRLVFGSNII